MSTAPSSRLSLAAEPRELTGKKVASLRRDGRLPAVVFGHGVSSENVSVDAHEFELLRRKAGQNALINLSVHGKNTRPVLVQGVDAATVTYVRNSEGAVSYAAFLAGSMHTLSPAGGVLAGLAEGATAIANARVELNIVARGIALSGRSAEKRAQAVLAIPTLSGPPPDLVPLGR